MAQIKHIRETVDALRAMAPRMSIEVIRSNRHHVLKLELDGVIKNVVMSSSPKVTEHAVRNTVRFVAKTFNLEPTIRC